MFPGSFTLPARAAARVGLAVVTLAWASQAGDPPRFPKPDPEQALAELKVFGSDGSAVRTPREDWAGARQRVSEDPAWQRWLTDQRGAMDDWMARRQDRVEWVSGWWHDFVSPRDGSFLTWTPDEPGEETLSGPSDPRVKLTPKLHAAWVFGFRTRHAAKLVEAAQLFRLTGERRYAEWTANQLDFYATNYLRWPEKPGRGCRLMWQSLDEAVNLVRFVHAVRLLDDAVPVGQRQRWFEQFFRPQAEMLETTFQRVHNIACWHRSAVGHVALCFADDALWQKAVEAPFGIRQQLARGVTSDYLWFEQSLGYNSYVVSALRPFFEYAQMAGRGAELRPEMAVLENLLLAPIQLRFPTGQLPNPADSTGGPGRAPNLAALAASYRLFPTPLGLTEAANRRDWNTLLDPPVPPALVPPLPAVQSRNLESSRMALLRRGDWQVFFHYGQLDASHAQAEALNYEVFLGDTPISHDPGTVGYGSPLHATYFTQGLAHNVPLLNGHGQAPWQPGELLAFDADRGHVAARQSRYRPDAAAECELHLEAQGLVVETRLALKADAAPAALGLALHLQGRVIGVEDYTPLDSFAVPHGPPGFRYWRVPRTASFTEQAVLRVDCGDRQIEVRIEVPGAFRVVHARTPDVPPQERESLYVETTGTSAVFRTTFRELTTQTGSRR
jgi:hypothetical protein